MKIWAISDVHGFHGQLSIPSDIDMILFSGDMSNNKESYKNYEECDNFLAWLEIVNVRWKLICAGNHDVSFEKKMVNMSRFLSIHYLEHESVNIEGINIFMSPYTPSFGVGWVFNRDRGKLDKYWQQIPENTDILVTHGPPKGILDLSHNKKGELEYCGDKALFNHIHRVKPQYSIFGHIHNSNENYNSGTRTLPNLRTIFINASCTVDGRYDLELTSQGVVFECNKQLIAKI